MCSALLNIQVHTNHYHILKLTKTDSQSNSVPALSYSHFTGINLAFLRYSHRILLLLLTPANH